MFWTAHTNISEVRKQVKPLQVDAQLLGLSSQYPDASAFREAVLRLSPHSREWVVRLWLTEGIPFAFRDRPAVYESVRGWLGERLHVCPKEVTLLGSARIGFSLACPPDYGRTFSSRSDLDLSIVSPSLFDKFSKSFEQWEADYIGQIVQPRHPRERQLWDENIRRIRTNLARDFMDANKIPTRDRYPIAQTVAQTVWVLKEKLEVTEGAPKVRKASIRVYRSWRALVARVSFNLRTALA
jgi:hypothetical protein